MFLSLNLGSEVLRREIHVGLNVVERWNGINDFIFYGKKGSFHSNRPEECGMWAFNALSALLPEHLRGFPSQFEHTASL
jgi:TnpA family transposase